MGLVRTSARLSPSPRAWDDVVAVEVHCAAGFDCCRNSQPKRDACNHSGASGCALQEKCQWNQLLICQPQPAYSGLLVRLVSRTLPLLMHIQHAPNACSGDCTVVRPRCCVNLLARKHLNQRALISLRMHSFRKLSYAACRLSSTCHLAMRFTQVACKHHIHLT